MNPLALKWLEKEADRRLHGTVAVVINGSDQGPFLSSQRRPQVRRVVVLYQSAG